MRRLSSPDLSLRLGDGKITVHPKAGKATSLPLKIIRGRGPDVRRQASPGSFNLFINAGPRLTGALRDAHRRTKALATSTGLLSLRLPGLMVDVERPIEFVQPRRRGPKLQGLSELVAEALVAHSLEELPPLTKLKEVCSGALRDGPSIAQIQKVLSRLEDEGILSVDRSRGPRFTRYFDVRKGDLLRLWAREHVTPVSRSLSVYVTARDPEAALSALRRARLRGRWAVGGPAAAQMWRPTLSRSPGVELWVDDRAWDDATALGAPVDEDAANLTIRRLAGGRAPLWFAHHAVQNGLPLVSPARAFVETALRGGPRLEELADALLESIA
ncbi:MAG: hypothetical protein HY775_04470 [Acidobacteria bacterium]|nr:hypothetical protein [Acidobacteriota bacterium]